MYGRILASVHGTPVMTKTYPSRKFVSMLNSPVRRYSTSQQNAHTLSNQSSKMMQDRSHAQPHEILYNSLPRLAW